MFQVANILCPEKTNSFNKISLSVNTAAERISELTRDIYETAQPAIFNRGN